MRRTSPQLLFAALAAMLSAGSPTVLVTSPPGAVTFFEEKIRPALAEHCCEAGGERGGQ